MQLRKLRSVRPVLGEKTAQPPPNFTQMLRISRFAAGGEDGLRVGGPQQPPTAAFGHAHAVDFRKFRSRAAQPLGDAFDASAVAVCTGECADRACSLSPAAACGRMRGSRRSGRRECADRVADSSRTLQLSSTCRMRTRPACWWRTWIGNAGPRPPSPIPLREVEGLILDRRARSDRKTPARRRWACGRLPCPV